MIPSNNVMKMTIYKVEIGSEFEYTTMFGTHTQKYSVLKICPERQIMVISPISYGSDTKIQFEVNDSWFYRNADRIRFLMKEIPYDPTQQPDQEDDV